MKLVELLARELSEWPKNVVVYFQWGNGEVFATSKGVPTEYKGSMWYVVGPDIDMAYDAPMYDKKLDLADDHDTANVNKDQWQAERDRQKGGEWKRNRGISDSSPVSKDDLIEVRFRNGKSEIDSGYPRWRHNGNQRDIMKFRVISQPQSEEVVTMSNPVKSFDLYGADHADHGPCHVQFIEAKTEQMETPFKWRDEVTELNAYIEKFTRERDALIERLASEGFALIPPVVSVVSEFSGIDMSDWRNWKAGDVVECTYSDCHNVYTVGNRYDVDHVTSTYARVSDDCGRGSFCHIGEDDSSILRFKLLQ